MDNHITLSGNLTRDPEIRYAQTGRARALLSLAVNRRWTGRDGERQEQVSFFNVVAWAALAENVAASLRKGDRVMLSGRLEQRAWETPEGEKKYAVEVIANDIAPSLRWATARAERSSPQTGTPAQPTTDEHPF